MKKFSVNCRARILCEDTNHYYFARDFLICLGVNKRKIELVADLPEGKGSGEQFVRKEFPDALKKYARNRENVFLACVMDVDNSEQEKLLKNLNEQAKVSAGTGIVNTDKLVCAFPKRNIETWFKWLDATDSGRMDIDEKEDYKGKTLKPKPGMLGKKAGELYIKCQDFEYCNELPSIKNACDSVAKLIDML